MVFAPDVAEYLDWDSGKLGTAELDPGQLLRDVAFEESNIERVGEAREAVRESGWDWGKTRDFLFGGGAVGLMALGYVPAAALKAGRGAAGAVGMLSSYDAASRAVRSSDVSAVRRALGRRQLRVSDEQLADGANGALLRLGFWQGEGRVLQDWTVGDAGNYLQPSAREGGQFRVGSGPAFSQPNVEALPTEFVARFAEFDRGTVPLGTDVDDLGSSLVRDGFNDSLILEVDPSGRAALVEGNHRVAAAQRAGISTVPVRVVTSRSGALAGRGAEVSVAGGLGAGKLLRPSEALEFSDVAVRDAVEGRIRLFHGVSPARDVEGGDSVDDVLRSILDEGLVGDSARTGKVYASDRLATARGFGMGDEGQQDLRVVVEFVADPARVGSEASYAVLDRVPAEDIAAIHLIRNDRRTAMLPGAGDSLILSTKQVNDDLKSILDDIDAARRADGGFTWDPRTNSFDVQDGYVVSVSPLHTKTVPVEEFTAQDIVDFLDETGYANRKVSQLLAEDPSKVIGGWVEDGEVYLDVSKVFTDRDEAVTIATRLGEKAVWDVKNGTEIYTDASKWPSLFARAALAGGAQIDTALLREISDSGLEKFFTGRVGRAELRPELTPIFFGDMSKGQKQWLAKELAKEKPKRVYTADDFDNQVLADWVAREKTYLESLGKRATANLGTRMYSRRYRGPGGDWVKKLNEEGTDIVRNKDGEPIDFKTSKRIPDRTSSPLVSFFEEMGLYEVPLSSKVSTGMHRKITKAILKGDTRKVAEIFAAQSNNLGRFSSAEALTPNFYPYMAYMTVTGARRIKAAALAPLLAASSAQVGPGGEAGRLLRAAGKLAGENKNYYRIQNGVAEWTGPTKSGYDINVQKAMVALANNPDFMMVDLPGVSVKTYVYALLKLNPRLSRALVVDTVDMQMRFASRMSPGWDTSKAGEMTEIALNQFASRAMASMMDIPAFSLQENGWAFFRSIRDRFAGTPKSLTYNRMPLRDIYKQVGMPDDLAALYQKNYAKLLEDVREGRAPHWQEMTKGVLVPSDNLPVEMLLPPAIRSKPGYVERFRDMITSAEELGRMLRRSE